MSDNEVTKKYITPDFCPKSNCICLRNTLDGSDTGQFCIGRLPKPIPHNSLVNTHQFCILVVTDGKNAHLGLYQINQIDAEWFEFLFEAVKEDNNRDNWERSVQPDGRMNLITSIRVFLTIIRECFRNINKTTVITLDEFGNIEIEVKE